jgi:molybdopterin converting factor small subunit
MALVRLFGPARDAAGTASATVPGCTIAAVMVQSREQFGDSFGRVLDGSRVWLNGDEADPATPVGDDDEVAVIPPVSGG